MTTKLRPCAAGVPAVKTNTKRLMFKMNTRLKPCYSRGSAEKTGGIGVSGGGSAARVAEINGNQFAIRIVDEEIDRGAPIGDEVW